MSDDFPTFDLPMKANSGSEVFGHPLREVLEVIKVADRTIMWGLQGVCEAEKYQECNFYVT